MLTLGSFAPASSAFTDTLQQLPLATFSIAIYAMLGVIGLLLLFVIVGKVKSGRLSKELASHIDESKAVQTELRERLDGINVGVVYIDADMAVSYANRTGAYFLGQKAEGMQGKKIASFLPDACQHIIQQIGGRDSAVQCELPARKKQFRIRVSSSLGKGVNAKAVMLIEDVHDFQQKLDTAAAMDLHMNNLYDSQLTGFGCINLSDKTIKINAILAKWLKCDGHDISVSDLLERISERDTIMMTNALDSLIKGEELSVTTAIQQPDGKVIPVVVHGKLAEHTAETDAPVAHISFKDNRDVVKAVNERDIARKRLTILTTNSTQAVYVLDAGLRFVDCNRAFSKLFKTDIMHLKGKTIDELKVFDDTFKALHHSKELSLAKRQTISTKLADDTKLTLNVVLQMVTGSGDQNGLMVIIEDHTELLALKQDVQLAKDRLSMLIDNSPMGIAMFGGDGKITEVNQTLCRNLDFTTQELQAEPFSKLFNSAAESENLLSKLQRQDQVKEFPAQLNSGTNKVLTNTLYASKISEIPQEYVCWIGSREEQDYLNSRFERLLKYASVPMAMLQERGFSQINSAACAFFGVNDEEELMGLTLTSPELNGATAKIEVLAQKLSIVSTRGQVVTINWQHQYEHQSLPCELTLIPIMRDDKLQSILCIWLDMRAIEESKAARIEAIKRREAAEEEVEAKKQLLLSSQSRLAKHQEALAETEQTLAETERRLQGVEESLSEKISTISDLRQAHKDISEHLDSLKVDYAQNRELLQDSQKANAELEIQLSKSSGKVDSLEKQRNEIAQALQYSERRFRDSQLQLEVSRKETERLKQQKEAQQKSVDLYVKQIADLQSSIEDKDKQIGDVSGQISTLQSQLNSSGETTEKLRQQLINQRKASELAEKERRELEMAFRKAQTEAESKARRIEHLQHEMEMFEEMSQQQKGNMEAHAAELAKELQAKQEQLKSTEVALTEIKQQAEAEKQEKAAQQERLLKLQNELADVEKRTATQQAKIAEADAKWKADYDALQEALKAKQAELQETETFLSEAKQQTEAEKQEKARQQANFEQLKNELAAMEANAKEQQSLIQQSEQKWQTDQETLANELAAKQAKLAAAEQELDNRQKQMDAEKFERESQQSKLEELKAELADVANRAAKQKEMMLGSDEQWRKHHEEIEAQKQQLQKALEEAQAQNNAMQSKLQSSMTDLASAEEKVSQTQSEEETLQNELNKAKAQAEELQSRLQQHEEQEAKLHRQVKEQQNALQSSQANIEKLEQQQLALTQRLEAVQYEHSITQDSLDMQTSSQADLQSQLASLEDELVERKSQLESREKALELAQSKLKESESRLAQQELALVDAQKAELQKAKAEAVPLREKPEFANMEMPRDASVWFDLLQYLQSSQQVSSMANSLNTLIDNLSQAVETMDEAVILDDHRAIMLSARKLIHIISSINSVPLKDMASRLAADCDQDNIDNISIYWPMAKQNLHRTLRVIYSHLYDE